MTAVSRYAVPLVLAAILSACATHHRPPEASAPVYSPSRPGAHPAQYVHYGYVRSIDYMRAQQATSGGGALAGAILGAVIGRQFGNGGNSRAAGTAIGAVGGAIVGNEIEKNQTGARAFYRVVVDLERGGTMVFNVTDDGGLRPGERVRIENNQIIRL